MNYKVIQQGDHGPIFYIGCDINEKDFEQYIPSSNYLLVLFQTNSWSADYSPWQANNPMGGSFEGNGLSTLNELVNSIIPVIHLQYPNYHGDYLVGYSLAGLFALWGYLENPLFDGAVVSSASLWFENFDTYLKNHQFRKQSLIYLSLGGKEEKTKNEVVASIGERYRQLSKDLKNQGITTTLVMNPGGHFTNSTKRMAQGIEWIIQQVKKRGNQNEN